MKKKRYNMLTNTLFMMGRAWKYNKAAMIIPIIEGLVLVGSGLVNLLTAPVILSKVETSVPMRELAATIAVFTGALILLNAARRYIETNNLFPGVIVRCQIMGEMNAKFCTTSYPNIEDPAFIQLADKAMRTCQQNSAAAEGIWMTIKELIRDLGSFVICIVFLSNLNWMLLVVIVVTTVIGYFVSKRANMWGYLHREELMEYYKQISYFHDRAEDMKFAKDVRVFGLRGWIEELYAKAMRLVDGFNARKEKKQLVGGMVDVLLSFLRNGVAYFFLINMALDGGLSAAEFLLYFTAASTFTTGLTGVITDLVELHKHSIDLISVREFLDVQERFRFDGGADVEVDPSAKYEIRFEKVSFRYPGAETDVIHDLDLTIHAGEKLAIVGLNGAGKTTLVKLMCGFYEPTEGRVLLNGRDIREFDRRQYYRLFGAVFQDFSVLEAPLEENVAQRAEDIDEARVWECLERAGLVEKAKSLHSGIKTPIGRQVYEDGVELSGGEIQRLMLARALYKNGPVLVLDEPTAALDPIAENDIYMKYSEMTDGRTSVFISHRLASTRFCDRILFIADGGVAEEGTHDSLIERGGKYAELFHVQSRYYQKDFGEEKIYG